MYDTKTVSADAVDEAAHYSSMPSVVIIAMPMERERHYASQLLQSNDVTTIEVPAYRDVITSLARNGASAILCDETLRWRDVLSQIAPMMDPPRLIVLTSTKDPALRTEILKLGGFNVLAKPIQPDELRWVVRVACSSPSNPAITRKQVRQETKASSLAIAG